MLLALSCFPVYAHVNVVTEKSVKLYSSTYRSLWPLIYEVYIVCIVCKSIPHAHAIVNNRNNTTDAHLSLAFGRRFAKQFRLLDSGITLSNQILLVIDDADVLFRQVLDGLVRHLP